MKKLLFFSAAVLMLAACGNKGGNAQATANAADSVEQVNDSAVFAGLIPAADCYGIRYRLALAADDSRGFVMTESYMKDETSVDTVFSSQGVVADTTVNGNKYYLLNNSKNEATRFRVVSDSILRMVNDSFEESVAGGTDYDLKLQ